MSVQQRSPFGLRMTDDLKEWVKEQARKDGRSMNNAILQILREKREAARAPDRHAATAAKSA